MLPVLGLLLFACSELDIAESALPSHSSSVITADEAIRIASGFSNNAISGIKSRSKNEVGDVFVVTTNDMPQVSRAESLRSDTLLYVINYTKNSGFSVVAAKKGFDDPVFIVSDCGYFNPRDIKSLPPAFLSYYNLTKYILSNEQMLDTFHIIKEVVADKFIPWDGVDRYDTIISRPLLYTKWSQKSPYGDFAPNGTAGCGPIAIAQAISYFYQPKSFSYVDNNMSHNVTLDWYSIKLTCENNGGQLSPTAQSESSKSVAHLIRYIGICVEAEYNENGSTSTNIYALLNWVKDYTNLNATDMETYNFVTARNAIIDKNIVLTEGFGYEENKEVGHGWIFDGYITIKKNGDAINNYLHCNWGWGGWCDGYYKSKVFNLYNGPKFLEDDEESGNRPVVFNDLCISTISR